MLNVLLVIIAGVVAAAVVEVKIEKAEFKERAERYHNIDFRSYTKDGV